MSRFLLKRIENVDGKPGRDDELGFAIGEFDTESYFGRAVSPEKLEETFGELTGEEIQSNRQVNSGFLFLLYLRRKTVQN